MYTLLIELKNKRLIRISSDRCWHLSAGYYVYTGSALGKGSTSLEKRLERHLKIEKKRFWHIDRLLNGSGRIVSIVYAQTGERMECRVNQKILSHPRAESIEGFGSSDCRNGCIGHLIHLHFSAEEDLINLIFNVYSALGLNPFHNMICEA